MHGIVKPRPTRVHFVDPAVPVGLESVTSNFLRQARTSALRHFEGHKFLFPSCFTLQCDVPGRADSGTSTGRIVAHVSPPVLKAWAAAASGTPAQRRAQVIVQLQLVLQDLSDHDVPWTRWRSLRSRVRRVAVRPVQLVEDRTDHLLKLGDTFAGYQLRHR